jgi:hypothetical protein
MGSTTSWMVGHNDIPLFQIVSIVACLPSNSVAQSTEMDWNMRCIGNEATISAKECTREIFKYNELAAAKFRIHKQFLVPFT